MSPVKITREERESPKEIKRREKRENPERRRRRKHPLPLTLPRQKSQKLRLPNVRVEEEVLVRDNSDHMNSRTTKSARSKLSACKIDLLN
jgi:hypothetical protein